MDWRAMSQRKASARKANPTGLLQTGETGGLTLHLRLLPPLIKQRSMIAPTGATVRTATSSGRQQTGTEEEVPGEQAKLKLNMVRITGGCVCACLQENECTIHIAEYLAESVGSYLYTGLQRFHRWPQSDVESVICRFADLSCHHNKCSHPRRAFWSPWLKPLTLFYEMDSSVVWCLLRDTV